MLRNKYVIMAVGVLFLAILAYNYSFFMARKAASRPPGVMRAATDMNATAAKKNTHETVGEYQATWRRDPFWYLGGVDIRRSAALTSYKTAAPSSGSGLRLDGTMTKDGKGYALMNGEVYGVGETVHGATILEIGNLFVTVKSSTGTKTIHITNDLPEKEK